MRLSRLMLCLSVAVCTLSAGAATEMNPARKHPQAQEQADVQSVIVKFRADNSSALSSDRKQAQSASSRVASLAQRSGLTLKESREIVSGMHVMKVQSITNGESLATVLARLRADSAVEYAEPDQRRYINALPNDPLFTGQWYLKNDGSTPSAIDAVTAWDTTTGDNSVVIAEIDTGVRYDHPDLSGRLLTGYDFISDMTTANDGGGRDTDASDPGDWCNGDDSSWHGTRVAGILGALSNNLAGIAGINWSGKILPVRALGKCGGVDSDIIPAMLWAAGIHVSGVNDNSTPAKIINMSIGGTGSCSQAYKDAISQIVARGALIVVSAGNEGGPVDSPANCPGVAGIAGLRHIGTKVAFSSLGSEIALSAPGGNCVNQSGACLYSIDTTTNSGTTSPLAGGTYTDQINYNVGTSFSAPIVAGIAALMASANGHLKPEQLIARLQSGSKPFPRSSDSSVLDCRVPENSTDIQEIECNCTTAACGAGMANAKGSVAEALRPIAVATGSPTTASIGQTVTLNGSGSFASNNRTIMNYAWTVVSSSGTAPSIVNANSANASFTVMNSSPVVVRLTVTDSQGSQDSADVGLNGGEITLSLSPRAASVSASGTRAFIATVSNASNAAVTWVVNGIAGGNSTVGTISASGVYTAPATVPSPATVTVTATSVANTAKSASAQVTIIAPVAVSVSPSSATVVIGASQTFTATVANTSNTAVAWKVNGIAGGNSVVGEISTSGVYTAPTAVPSPATVTVTATSQADTSKSGSAQVTITQSSSTQGNSSNGGGGGALGAAELLACLLALLAARRRQQSLQL